MFIAATAPMKKRARPTPFFSTTVSSAFFGSLLITQPFTHAALAQHVAFAEAPAPFTEAPAAFSFASSVGFSSVFIFAPILPLGVVVKTRARRRPPPAPVRTPPPPTRTCAARGVHNDAPRGPRLAPRSRRVRVCV